jgi:formylglycine-generating enzyme required for sulfatase activity
VEDVAVAFPKCRILVTSRIYAYQKQGWRLPGFTETVLAPFSPGQIERFVDRWYEHIGVLRSMDSEGAQGRAALLKRAIAASDRLQALAKHPLLLTLMASLHAWRGGSLPERREELYADAVDLLLDWWERQHVVRDDQGNVVMMQPSLAEWLKIDRDKARQLLDRLAYEAHAAQPELVGSADVPEADLVVGLMQLSQTPDANPARLVEYLSRRAGLLLPRGVGVYTFPHRTFQEYLAACHLTDHDYPDAVARLAREDPNRWREVVLLAGAKAARGTTSAIWILADALCYRDLDGDSQGAADAWGGLLAGQALVESANLDSVSERNQTTMVRVQSHLVQILEEGQLPAVERVSAGQVLAELGDPRPGLGLCDNGIPDIAWCQVPAGPFLMGSNKDDKTALSSEKPQHVFEIHRPYAISRYPVTNTQFGAFMAAEGYGKRRYWTKAGWEQKEKEGWTAPKSYSRLFELPNHPVVGISWYEALAFCNWMTEKLQQAGELEPEARVMLPSEPQWEKAARGEDGRIYPWGNDVDPDKANCGDTGIGSTSAVGCFPGGVSPYGLEDMSGNVCEWTLSLDAQYPYSADDGRENLESAGIRILRGESFNSEGWLVRCAFRNGNSPTFRLQLYGFRVVMVSVNEE